MLRCCSSGQTQCSKQTQANRTLPWCLSPFPVTAPTVPQSSKRSSRIRDISICQCHACSQLTAANSTVVTAVVKPGALRAPLPKHSTLSAHKASRTLNLVVPSPSTPWPGCCSWRPATSRGMRAAGRFVCCVDEVTGNADAQGLPKDVHEPHADHDACNAI